ncbi:MULTISPECIES: nad binding enzyme [Bacillus]|uniref:nad binding enzyme n=1 Tax=Bacillus TaxID=1386 RepID=UPI000D02699C|nr:MULTISPECIES: nad binding enzyme [Bacillus]MDG4728951.1 nad binding enzyme [Bacillus pumilus]PRS47294.1 nad binding enzyme [Bacillus sp. GBSC66]PRS70750.1 nad binding enzyme [Bacillus sp. NMTD17]PRS82814.1 nad binding enzyme [Bacillus sp. CJCL2]PRS87563.1 nad binding enzyme [Bacillus sp. YBWC18]
METGLIIGADEFFGLALCEYMMKEGIQVDITCPHDHTEEQKMLLEERMMWLGRNDLFRVIDLQDGKDTYDLIFIQSEESDKRHKDMKAKHGMYRVLYEKPEDESSNQNVPAVILPRMFGPWALNKERTKRDEAFFVEDVARDLFKWASGTEQRQETHELKVERQTDDKQAEEMMVEWKRQNSTFFDKKQE